MTELETSDPVTDLGRPPRGLFTVVGVVGLLAAIGAGAGGGMLGAFGRVEVLEYSWGSTLRYASILALVGGVLLLARREVGFPIVVGSSAAIVAVVGTLLAGLRLQSHRLLDPYPVRGALLIAGATCAVFGVMLGLAGLRGAARAGYGVPTAVLLVVALLAIAGTFQLDQERHVPQVRPFLGFALIALVGIVGCFAGRDGILAAGSGAATIVAQFLDRAELDERRAAAVIAVLALVGVIGLSVAGAATRARDRSVPIDIADDVSGREVAATTSTAPVAKMPRDDFAATADQLLSGHPIIAPFEPTGAIPAHTPASLDPEHDVPTMAVSTIGQWAPDPFGRHQFRFWDGANWTEHVETDGATSTDPLS